MTRTWLVTGSSRGLGRHLVLAVLERGDRVIATARRAEHLVDLGRDCDDRIRRLSVDVTDTAAAARAVQTAVDEFGALDVVVNNAGYANSAPIETGTDEDFRAQLETNLFGVVNITRAALPVLRSQGRGHIIQISSIVGRVGAQPGLAAYSTAKWGVEGFSEVLRAEVAEFGVRVTVIEPGGLRTDWAGESMSMAPVPPQYATTVATANEARKKLTGRQAGDPARAAELIIELASSPEPPFRVIFGSGAIATARRISQQWVRDIEEWADFGARADYPEPAARN
jgi:NAD(P)-dependent dehydrogenase (short-subunit alcohol dehydrogenase family)